MLIFGTICTKKSKTDTATNMQCSRQSFVSFDRRKELIQLEQERLSRVHEFKKKLVTGGLRKRDAGRKDCYKGMLQRNATKECK